MTTSYDSPAKLQKYGGADLALQDFADAWRKDLRLLNEYRLWRMKAEQDMTDLRTRLEAAEARGDDWVVIAELHRVGCASAAATLRAQLEAAENRSQEHLNAHMQSFGALAKISAMTDLEGEVDDYGDVVASVERLRKQLDEAEKDRAWLIQWHRIWHRPGSLLRWAALTAHQLRVPRLLAVVLNTPALAREEEP